MSSIFLRNKIGKFIAFLSIYMASHGWISAQSEQLERLRIWHSPESTRIVFDVSSSTGYKTFLLQNPQRLVVDLDQLNLSVDLPKVESNNRHLQDVRSGKPSDNVLRVVFDLKRQVNIESFVLTPNELYGHRLVIDLTDAAAGTENQLAKNSPLAAKDSEGVATSNPVKESLDESKSPQQASSEIRANQVNRPFVVAIDAGHGGDDPGALGHRGTKEKRITLSISKKLRDRINKHPNMKAVMIRTGDYYIKLKGRRDKARKAGADAFISIHADAFAKKSANGMSVFALSQRGATSAMASALAAKENASDLMGGVSLADKDDVLAKVLVDLSMTNTVSESVNLGGRVLKELGKLGRLHSKRVEQANFSVLRSPDVPSILVETGFITNPDEERRLRTTSYQNKIARAIFVALEEYYEQTPYASAARYSSPNVAATNSNTKSNSSKVVYGRHKVRRGDTLSTIAEKYGISLRELKRLNGIKHNTAMLGVRLKVPMGKRETNSSKPSTVTKSVKHKVKSGDSLSKISARYNVTIRSIKRANGLTRNTLKIGQILTIPGVSASRSNPARHKVVRGDTLSEIAQKYGTSVSKIKTLNKLKSNNVMLGQVLKIPN